MARTVVVITVENFDEEWDLAEQIGKFCCEDLGLDCKVEHNVEKED